MSRSTFKVLFYVNGSKEKDGIVPIVTSERRKTKKEQADGKRKYCKKNRPVRLKSFLQHWLKYLKAHILSMYNAL